MALNRFKIVKHESLKALVLAECSSVPPVMIIAGPNGVGKSSLLWAIKRKIGQLDLSGSVLYLSPHRSWIPQNVNMISLLERSQRNQAHTFSEILAQDGQPNNVLNEVKYVLSQFEMRKQVIVNRLHDQKKWEELKKLSDIYSPLRELTEALFLHLRFSRVDIDTANNNQTLIRCLFTRSDAVGTEEIEIDQLSSGERAVITLFMPFLEEQIDQRLVNLEGSTPRRMPASDTDLVVLIDEPELHLHPALQPRILDYIRNLTSAGNVQFVIATHSPVLLNAASYSELYVLTPPTNDPDYNQLVQLSNDTERLRAMRDLSGDTYVLTACRNIICVEGELPSAKVRVPTDIRILELLCPEIKAHILIPSGGKGIAIGTAQRLRELLSSGLPVISVFALVDADQTEGTSEDWIVPLPVAMIENLLLVPEAIWRFLVPYKEKLIGLTNQGDVKDAILRIAQSRRDAEISLRVQGLLKTYTYTVRISGYTVEQIQESLNTPEARRINDLLSNEDELRRIIGLATAEVDAILEQVRSLQLFHGKNILRDFFKHHLHSSGISFDIFCVEVAKIIGADAELRKPMTATLAKIASNPLMLPDDKEVTATSA